DRAKASALLSSQDLVTARFQEYLRRRFTVTRIRTHGDLHLGQVLHAGKDFAIIDFEGEPARPLSERRRKRSALRDVSGMLRSFVYAASASSIECGAYAPERWEERVRDEFLAAYLEAVHATIVPAGVAYSRQSVLVGLD